MDGWIEERMTRCYRFFFDTVQYICWQRGLISVGNHFQNIEFYALGYIWDGQHVYIFGKPVEKTRQNPYPRLKGMGFVRVEMLLPRPVPQHSLPATPAGF